MNVIAPINNRADAATCQAGTWVTTVRAGMIRGEVKGKSEKIVVHEVAVTPVRDEVS